MKKKKLKVHFRVEVNFGITGLLGFSAKADAPSVKSPRRKWGSLSGEETNDLVPNNPKIRPEMTNFDTSVFLIHVV